MKRTDVPKERKWDLTPLFQTEQDWENEYRALKEEESKYGNYRGTLTPETAYVALDAIGDFSRRLERLYMYAALKKDENTADSHAQELLGRVENLNVSFGSRTAYVSPELAGWSEKDLEECAKKAEYARHSVFLRNVIEEKKHILSASEEQILAEYSLFTGDFKHIFTMLDNADLSFKEVSDGKGGKIKLSHGVYSMLLQNQSQEVRKEAFETYYAAYSALKNTIASTYAGSVKKDCAVAKVRRYESAMKRALDAEFITPVVYDNLIEAVEEGTPKVHEYVALRKKALGLKELHMYDMYVPITEGFRLELGYDEAFDLVEEALKPLGEDYLKVLREGRHGGWIDVEETENKRSGAYSWGAYDGHPYVLLNYQPVAHDVFTIAHEMGHAIHSYRSNAAQCYEQAGYEIFVAEVASTVNEVLLLKHLLKTATGELRAGLLSYYLDMFRTTLFRQTMFAEFEKYSHEETEKGNALTADGMDAYYYELNKKYYGPAVVHDEQIATEWMRIPHFYNAFYVYKYATGLTSAINIAANILKDEGFQKKYFEFLSAGGSKKPLETLLLAGVDLTKKEPFAVAMKEFSDTLEELKRVMA